LKTRLLGAFVLVALMVLFVPMFFSSSPPTTAGDQAVSLAIPPAPDRDLQTRTMSLDPDAPATGGSAPVIPAPSPSATAPSDRLATVEIASQRPRDVEMEPEAAAAVNAQATQPVVPMRPPEPAPAPEKPAAAPASPSVDTTANTAGTAARGSYTLNLSAYSNAGAQRLMQKVRALGYPVTGKPISQGGKSLTLVSAGPFSSRTAAEAARLKISQSIPGAPAHLESGASDQHGDVAAAPTTGPARAGGFAVQVAAMGSQADANALRDKLRAAGFDGFTDSVSAGGRRLWRVRAGPQIQRADAEHVRDQIKARLGMTGNVVSMP
jgi:DedD protein